MILTNRLFTRREPDRDAKSIYIFCEGKKREHQYFSYFQGIDSRINIIVYQLQGHEDNSPLGLYQLATKCLLKTDQNPSPQYEWLEEDEVWFVVDTDAWGDKLAELRDLCQDHERWGIAQSNPCFEVWLYFHFFEKRAEFQWMDICQTWKEWLDREIPGGFNSARHPLYVGRAIENAFRSFCLEDDAPAAGCTGVFRPAKVIWQFCARKIEQILHRI